MSGGLVQILRTFVDSSILEGEVGAGFDPLGQLQLCLLLQRTQILHPDVTMSLPLQSNA